MGPKQSQEQAQNQPGPKEFSLAPSSTGASEKGNVPAAFR